MRNTIQQKKAQFHANIQKQQREQIRAKNRVWNELPSVIVELPARIQQGDWIYFEQLLDSITENDLLIIDQQLVAHMRKQLKEASSQLRNNYWRDEKYFNILRAILRMRIATVQNFTTVVMMLQESHQQFLKQGDQQNLEGMLKLVKEIVIYLQSNYQQTVLGEENEQLLRKVVSNMKIYMCWFETKMEKFADIFENYRLYYISLVANPLIQAQCYVQHHNVGQLFFLIEDSLRNKQTGEIVKSVDVIMKMLKLDDSSKENRFTLNGLHILLIDGLERAKLYTSSFQHIDLTGVSFQFSGFFFSQLLKVLNRCEVQTLIHSIQLLGLLFQVGDCHIEAVMKIKNKSYQAELQKNTKNAERIKRTQFLDYAQFFKFSVSSLLAQVRYKTYWVISNILGSERLFFEYGFQFFKEIFESRDIWREESQQILDQINFCILNFACNLHNNSSIVEVLAGTCHSIQPAVEAKENARNQNAFQFILASVLKLLQRLYNISELHEQSLGGIDDNFGRLFHRSLYSLQMLVEVVRQEKETRLEAQIFGEAYKMRIPLYLETLGLKLKKGGEWKQVEELLDQVIDLFSRQEVPL